jgi:hypothetical protein
MLFSVMANSVTTCSGENGGFASLTHGIQENLIAIDMRDGQRHAVG